MNITIPVTTNPNYMTAIPTLCRGMLPLEPLRLPGGHGKSTRAPSTRLYL